MISFRYGVRLVRQRPGSEEAFEDSMRCRSDHSDTDSSGSGTTPLPPGTFDVEGAFVFFQFHHPPGPQFAEFDQVIAHGGFRGHVQFVGVDLQLGRHLRGDARRPVEPGIAFGARQPEDMGNRLRPIDQIPFELARAHLLVCALTTSLTVLACSSEVPPVETDRGSWFRWLHRPGADRFGGGGAGLGWRDFLADTVFCAHSRSARFGRSIVPSARA